MQRNQSLPFRQAQGPELAEGQPTAARCAARLKDELRIMKERGSLPPSAAELILVGLLPVTR